MSVVSTTTQIYNNEGLSSCSSSSMVLSFTLVVTNDHPMPEISPTKGALKSCFNLYLRHPLGEK